MRAMPRWRTVLLAILFTATTFAVDAAPVNLPAPLAEALGPTPVQAGFCASNAAFTGRLTASSSSTTAVSRTTSPTVYGYISSVQAAWSCTLYYRYSGITWNTSATLGTFRWGNLINSQSVACNFVVGSTDYIKGNSTSDCPDTDAEYALSASLSPQGVYQRDINHNSIGDFSFVQTDCGSYYGGALTITDHSWSTSTSANRPGANCDSIDTDDTNTSQTITYDSTNPTVAITSPASAGPYERDYATYQPVFNPSDNVAGFGGSYVWSLQRQKAPVTALDTCGTWANDTAAGNLVTGTAEGSQTAASQTLANVTCYRWKLTAEDQNGNGPVSVTSGTLFIDQTNPAIDFTTPNEGTTTTQNTTGYSVAWTETEAHSGVASRSLQRQRVAATSSACPGTFANDGGAVTTASPSAQTLATGFCYQWIQTLTDGAGNVGTKTSGKLFVDAASPSANFTTPNEGTTTLQTATTYSVAWTESAGVGLTITARSLQRQKGAIVTPSTCAGATWANDGTAVTTVSPVNLTGLLGGNCYRWIQTLTNSGGKTGATTSGSVLVDTVAPVGTITAPAANAPIAGNVTITGSATDAHTFKEYQLEYGAGASPSSWTSIAVVTSQVPATGTLYTWSPGTLSGVYTIRLTVRQNASTTTAVATRTVVLENAERGEESYHTRTQFDLGGGWDLDVGVHNGEARLSRDLFSIPSYGPAQALDLSYSSLETGTAGRFGTGWNSNLTQYLSFDATDIVVWHRADGGRVPFGKVAGVWTALAGHYETLSLSGSEYTVTQKDQSKLVFESTGAGRLKRIENRFAKALTLVWNTSSATATDASGRVTNLVIDSANNRITSATDSAGRVWGFGYTGTSLTSVTDPASKVTTLAYTGGLLTSVTRSRSRVSGAPETVTWMIGYAGGKVTAVTDPVAATTASTFTYNPTSTDVGLLRETSPDVLRDIWTYELDSLGRPTDVTDPLGFVTSTTFDPNSNATAVKIPIETGTLQSTTNYTYDAKANVLTEIAKIDASTNVTTVYTYNATNDLLTRTDADEDSAVRTVTKYTYDGSGHLTSVNANCTTSGTTPPASGAGGTCTGAGTQDASTNLITNYAYTTNDQLAFEQDALGRVTKYGYDTWGNQTSLTANCTSSGTTPPSPFSSCTGGGTADAQTNVTSTMTYDQATTAGKAGLATKTTDALSRDTTFTYDALGRQLTEVLPGDASIPALTRTTTYDEFGNLLTDVEAWTGATRTTSHVHDLANRETSVIDPAGVTSTTTYDLAGNAVGATAGGVTTTRIFDGRGRTLSETNDAGTSDHAYDAPGNEIQTVSAEGEVSERTFTRTGQVLTETTDPSGVALTVAHTYDRLGRELTVTAPYPAAGSPTSTTTTTYDRTGRQVTSQVTGGPLVTTTYDRGGSAVGVLGADSRMSASLVDPLDRVVTSITNCTNTGTTVPAAGTTCAGTGTTDATTNVTTRTYYDKTGTVIAVKDPKGITARTLPNVRGLANEAIANCTDSGTTPTSNPPTCTGAGTANATTNVETTIAYDGSGAPVSTITAVGTGAAATTETAYDAAGRIQTVKDPMGTISRSFFDASTGQLTKTVVNCTTSGTTIPSDWIGCTGAGTSDGTYNLTTTYGYDTAGNQTSIVAPNGRETRIEYDADGRIVTRTDNYVDGVAGTTDDLVTTYYHDAGGRQAAILAPTADGGTFTVARFVYDANGRLWKEIRACTNVGTTFDPLIESPGDCTGNGTANAATNVVTEFQYDDRGNRIRLIAPDPSATTGTATATVTTQHAFDAADRLCRVVENATGSTDLQTLADPCATATQTAGTATTNVSTRYSYDPAGNLATMVDARGNTTTYGYDAAGRMTSLTDSLGETLVWVYDALGNKLRQENRADPIGTFSVQWTYDGAGRIQTRQADGVTTTYTYDANGNKLTASDGTLTITSTYDRLNRPLTVDDEDAGSTADTTYTYSLTSPAWTDPTGSYGATLDAFDRATAVNDPVNASDFTWTYRADGQPASFGQPNGNTTAYAYDATGRLISKDTTATAPTDRALYDWTHNRAGQILTEASTVTGDASNGTVTYAYDPLGRLTGSTLSGTTTTYGWDAVPNRTSVQVGAGTPATTAYDAADRPTTGANPSAAYTSDDDGRLTARPGYRYEWDHLGRLTKVRPPTGNSTIATYSYDPLDRLRLVDYGGSDRIRFRYVGLTTSVAQWLDDQSGAVTRHVANGWGSERLSDWTGSGSNLRVYGTNGHHDTTWLATSTGSVSQALRYDAWGNPRATVPIGYTPFRFQGSWFDEATEISWVVTRWYAPAMGRFISEDNLLGDPMDPPSRHLYAYAEGEPTGHWDPDGRALKEVSVSFADSEPYNVGGYGGGYAKSNIVGAVKMQANTGTALVVPREAKKYSKIKSSSTRYTGGSTNYNTARYVRLALKANWKWYASGFIVAGGSLHVIAVDAHIIDTTHGVTVAGGRFETASVGCFSVITIGGPCNTTFASDETYTLRNAYFSKKMYKDSRWRVRVTATAWVRAVQGWAATDLSLTNLAAKIAWYQ
jgi:RHS repeat-associated protein